MPIKLIAPGKRKGNRFYLLRGSVAGRRIESTTKTTDKRDAEQLAAEITVRLHDEAKRQRGPDAETLTFEEAAQLYIGFRKPAPDARHRIDRIVAVIGARSIRSLTHADIVGVANDILPGRTNQTKNRAVVTPMATILHYMADLGYREWLRVKLFKEPKPKTRAATRDARKLLLANTAGKQRLMILWLFGQGTRISDTLRVNWPQINLQAGTVDVWVSKTAEWRKFPLADDVLAALANEDKTKRLWPWTWRGAVYHWLRPLRKRLGITFTPHMARHSLGTWLNESGAGLRTIMDALGHESAKSSLRYQAGNIATVREAKRLALGGGVGKARKSR